jgi:hypothetical protein
MGKRYYVKGHYRERKDKSWCFIATAAYGSPMAPELDLLRTWRDVELSSMYLGRTFIEVYYRLSPPIARFIEKRDVFRLIVRTLLVLPITILKNRKKKRDNKNI